ncbi:MAG: GAF domain-containing sensor histidine kinase [Xenococcaceae cyanobacterium]
MYSDLTPQNPQGRILSGAEIDNIAIALADRVKNTLGCDRVLIVQFNLILPNHETRIVADASEGSWCEIVNKDFVSRHLRTLSQQVYANPDTTKEQSLYCLDLASLGIHACLTGCIEVRHLEWGALICWNETCREWSDADKLLVLQVCRQLEESISMSSVKPVFIDRGYAGAIAKIKSLLNTPSDRSTFEVLVKSSLHIVAQLFKATNCSIFKGDKCLFTLNKEGGKKINTPYLQVVATENAVTTPIAIDGFHWGFAEIERPNINWNDIESVFLRKAGFIICNAIADKESDYLQAYYLERITEKAPIVLYRLDRLGNCIFCQGNNFVDREIFHAELLGKNIFEETSRHPKNQQLFKEALASPSHSGFLGANGTVFHNHTVLLENGEVIGVAIDCTEQLTFQKDLESVMYTMSHDLQEPLRAIANNQKLLENRLTSLGVKDSEINNRLQRGFSSVKKLSELIEEQLELSRINSTKKPFETIDSLSVVHEAIENLTDAISKSNARIAIITPLPVISGDRTQIISLFQNLIGNAIKFHEGDEHPSVWISCNMEGNRFWRYAIADDGIGIEPEYQKQIFEIWKRLHEESRFPGTGIGLAICRKIVQRHKGTIWVESEGEGKGSTFYFTIPIPSEGLLFSEI